MAEGEGETKWYAGFDADTQNQVTNLGLADKDPVEAFQTVAKSYREAQAYIGVPKDQLLKLPKPDAPPEEWDEVYTRLGYSTNPDDYKLEGLKLADGTDVDNSFKDFLRSQAADLKLSPANAEKLAAAVLKHQADGTAALTSEQQEQSVRALEQLRASWGPNYEANKVIADNAYAAMMAAAGFSQEQMTAAVQKLGDAMGKAEAMQMLLAVGQKLGEDKFVGGGMAGGNLAPRTAEQAVARIAELKADTTWVGRYLAGGATEAKEMTDLHQLAYGDG